MKIDDTTTPTNPLHHHPETTGPADANRAEASLAFMKDLQETLRKNDWEITKRENPFIMPCIAAGVIFMVLSFVYFAFNALRSLEEGGGVEGETGVTLLMFFLLVPLTMYGLGIVFSLQFVIGDPIVSPSTGRVTSPSYIPRCWI